MANRVSNSDVAVTFLARWLSRLMPVIIIAIFLAICMGIYAIAWGFKNR